jgi:methylmalonyl-CoA mutase cobalamin-binding domain/chain
MEKLQRKRIFPEPHLPASSELLAEGRQKAGTIRVGSCAFLKEYGVQSESEYKRRRMREKVVMLHAQVGYRDPGKTRRACAEIHDKVAGAGHRVDRYGICLDWSMGYPQAQRDRMPRGTGLILQGPEDFAALTCCAPVAPHFGDFVMGTPAAFENTAAALLAGSTAIGNLGQYFTFRMPGWSEDIETTAATIRAMALCAAQPVEVLIHSNLDDGYAALFCDLACGIGMALLERYIVDELIGGRVSHCFGHVFSDPLTRMAFQRALGRVCPTPGSMVYGNTTIYVAGAVENYANLASYLLTDILAQRAMPTGHGLNPVPVTEAMRIPEIDEIIDAQLFANRLIQRADGYLPMLDWPRVDAIADRLVAGGQAFKERILQGLAEAGIDTSDPFELLLALRRLGAKRLEEWFGPGPYQEEALRHRVPLVKATTIAALEAQGGGVVASLAPDEQDLLRQAGLKACVTCTDVHEYGKILVETVLSMVGIAVHDGGVSADPDQVARQAQACGADFIAVSTYNGVALRYMRQLREELTKAGLALPIFVGGKLNQIPEDSPDSLPVDVSAQLRELGATVCLRAEDILAELTRRVHSGAF